LVENDVNGSAFKIRTIVVRCCKIQQHAAFLYLDLLILCKNTDYKDTKLKI